ncbi:unnamed protein product [Blepharisma stoltei]|uniref:Uncharacterized protein n=1 Tax=Blepharisma stoltei TaxID=1481888 RepID=A0AAU9JID0_9CILI|nr:unnamed protein product [Blepharisma stoltei]
MGIWSEQAHKDLVSILKLRYKELAPLGRLILQFADRTHESLISNIWQEASENMFSKGIINEEEKRDLTIPMYRRSAEEIQRALDEMHDYFRVLESKSVDMPRSPGRASRQYIEHIKKFAAVSMKTPLERAIKTGQAEVDRFLGLQKKKLKIL